MLDAWTAGVRAAGQVTVQELWSQLDKTSIRKLIRDAGLSDRMWGEIDAVIKNVDLRASLQEGKLTIGRIGDDAGGIGLLHAARGPAQTLDDLLRRGQFEQWLPLLAHLDAPGLRLVRGIPTEVEPADVVLVAAAVGTRLVHPARALDRGRGTACIRGCRPGHRRVRHRRLRALRRRVLVRVRILPDADSVQARQLGVFHREVPRADRGHAPDHGADRRRGVAPRHQFQRVGRLLAAPA